MPFVPPLLAAGMTSSDDRASGGIPCNGADGSTCCGALHSVGRPLLTRLLLGLLLLLSLLLLLGLGVVVLGLRLLLFGRRRWLRLP